jgi:hypothetical protein
LLAGVASKYPCSELALKFGKESALYNSIPGVWIVRKTKKYNYFFVLCCKDKAIGQKNNPKNKRS